MANITYRVNSDPAIPGTSIVKGTPLTNVEVDANFRAIDIEVDQLNSSTVRLTGDQTIGGIKRFTSPVEVMATLVSGDSVEINTGGSGDRYSFIDFHSSGAPRSLDFSTRIIRNPGVNGTLRIAQTGTGGTSVDGNLTATGNITTGGQFIGNVTGNADTVTNGVYTTGDQTIGGNKTFSGAMTLNGKQVILKTTAVTVGSAGASDQWELANNGSGACVMSFHRHGVYAINMGLDTDNVFRLGGWSQGANSFRWTSDTAGNFVALGNITANGQFIGNGSVPPGAVMHFAMNSVPTGWLRANGAAVSRTTFAALFNAIGTTYGAGDGSTTFNLPDLRGEFLRGWDDGRGVDSGRAFGSAQAGEIQSHTHVVQNVSTSSADVSFVNMAHVNAMGNGSRTSNATGGTETRPRNVALLACIKF